MSGNSFPIWTGISFGDLEDIVKCIVLSDAKANLPAGTTVEIHKVFTGLDEPNRIAWYSSEEMQGLPPKPLSRPVYQPKSGVYYCGRFVI